jgi:hypothetical protein
MSSVANSLRRDVELLALPAGRMVGSAGHAAAQAYLLQRLGQLSLTPYRNGSLDLPYRVDGQDFHNLIAVLPGTDRSLAPVLIGAHYDSVIPSWCADDNAAAVAIALSAAEALSKEPLSRDVVIALFDAEEPPYFHQPSMGSTRFFEDQMLSAGVHAALIMDLVGHDVSFGNLPLPSELGEQIANLLFVTGAESHPGMARLVQHVADQGILPVVAALNSYVGDMSDHHVFHLHGVPYLFLTCGAWDHYHQVTDTPERLNYEKMARIRDVLVTVVRGLDGDSLLSCETPRPGDDYTLQMEIDLLNRGFGPALHYLLQLAGLRTITTRADVDELSGMLARKFIPGASGLDVP